MAAGFYPYLISSLPSLHFGMKPPFSFERFIELCSPWVPEQDLRELRALPLPAQYGVPGKRPVVISRWVRFDTALRNELARIRAGRIQVDPAPFLRPGGIPAPVLPHGSVPAWSPDAMLETEMRLDEVRWEALEELKTNHSFDLDIVVTYALQLLILLRWEKIRAADGALLLKEALDMGRAA